MQTMSPLRAVRPCPIVSPTTAIGVSFTCSSGGSHPQGRKTAASRAVIRISRQRLIGTISARSGGSLRPEMGPPEMMPPGPGMPAGMGPGDFAMMEPGMGMEGFGMGQMEPAEPMKIRINVSLVIRVVGL